MFSSKCVGEIDVVNKEELKGSCLEEETVWYRKTEKSQHIRNHHNNMLQISGFIRVLTNSPKMRSKIVRHIMTMRLLQQERLAARAASVTQLTLEMHYRGRFCCLRALWGSVSKTLQLFLVGRKGKNIYHFIKRSLS